MGRTARTAPTLAGVQRNGGAAQRLPQAMTATEILGDRMTATYSGTPIRQTLADRMRTVRSSVFVGRDQEIAVFRSSLVRRCPTAEFVVLYVWGVGGVGKSALLRRFGDEAEASGRQVVRVDARLVDGSPAGLERVAAEALLPGRVLLVDNVDDLSGSQAWFWDRFLPDLPEDVLIVVAGRQPPDPGRCVDPEWAATVRAMPLGDLSRRDALRLLGLRGVPERLAGSLYALAGGHPLALLLAAELPGRDMIAGGGPWAPYEPAVKMLFDRLIGDPPTFEHRRALDICAHVLATREDLLRSVFGDQGAELFAWLRGLPIIEAGPYGIRPRELARELLVADLHWRDPDGWRAVYQQVRPYFLERASSTAPPQALPAVAALTYLHRYGDTGARFFSWRADDELVEDAYRDSDRKTVLALADELGERAVVAFWLDHQPRAFRVCRRRDTGVPVAFVCWLRLDRSDAAENAADPKIAAVWAHIEENGPLALGKKVAVQRFVHSGAEPGPTPVCDLLGWRALATWLLERDLAWTYIVAPKSGAWAPALKYAGHTRLTGQLSSVFAHHWAAVPVPVWLESMQDRLLRGAQEPVTAELSREDFSRAVRELLRCWRHRPSVENTPLLSTRLAGRGPAPDRVERVREVIEEAIDSLRGTPRGDKLHRTLAVTFFQGTVTQEAAAERLGLPFGTYRHRLSAGVEYVVERLWQRAAAG